MRCRLSRREEKEQIVVGTWFSNKKVWTETRGQDDCQRSSETANRKEDGKWKACEGFWPWGLSRTHGMDIFTWASMDAKPMLRCMVQPWEYSSCWVQCARSSLIWPQHCLVTWAGPGPASGPKPNSISLCCQPTLLTRKGTGFYYSFSNFEWQLINGARLLICLVT